MKNIHILPTNKPSRLYLGNNGNFVFGMIQNSVKSKNDFFTNQHIYITSDEEIKFNDYITDGYKVWQWKDDSSLLGRKKIILTTDPVLIKDGVQAIDDEFLEWFVNNPSCEEVEVERKTIIEYEPIGHAGGVYNYKIIIPKEEPKQIKCYDKYNEVLSERDYVYVQKDDVLLIYKKEKPKQETIEEAANEYIKTVPDAYSIDEFAKEGFIEGAKWQEKQYFNEKCDESCKYHCTKNNSQIAECLKLFTLEDVKKIYCIAKGIDYEIAITIKEFEEMINKDIEKYMSKNYF